MPILLNLYSKLTQLIPPYSFKVVNWPKFENEINQLYQLPDISLEVNIDLAIASFYSRFTQVLLKHTSTFTGQTVKNIYPDLSSLTNVYLSAESGNSGEELETLTPKSY